MAYKKKSNRTRKPKKKYSAAQKRAYNIGVGVALGRSADSAYEVSQRFQTPSLQDSCWQGFKNGQSLTKK